jgi:hypothetical protein
MLCLVAEKVQESLNLLFFPFFELEIVLGSVFGILIYWKREESKVLKRKEGSKVLFSPFLFSNQTGFSLIFLFNTSLVFEFFHFICETSDGCLRFFSNFVK